MSDEHNENDEQDEMQILNQIIEDHTEDLMARANVVGVGVGLRQVNGQYTDEKAIVVMVSKKMPMAQLGEEDVIPEEIDGIHVDVQEMGMFMAGSA
ncbi:MAG: hypothetical protein RLP44_26275 [Aggregatilineales bacterium]